MSGSYLYWLAAKNGAYPFRATIVVRDYGAGYPRNRYTAQPVWKLVDQDITWSLTILRMECARSDDT